MPRKLTSAAMPTGYYLRRYRGGAHYWLHPSTKRKGPYLTNRAHVVLHARQDVAEQSKPKTYLVPCPAHEVPECPFCDGSQFMEETD